MPNDQASLKFQTEALMQAKFTRESFGAVCIMHKILNYFILCSNRIKFINSEKHLKLKLFIYSYHIH